MRALSMLIKPASANCNMRCRYCFYTDISDVREVKTHGIMKPETLEIIVRKALEEATEFCSFAFQGGEPTLAGLDFFRELLQLEKKYNKKNVKIAHALQTNGMLIDEEWAAFLAENGFLTGLSIDGGRETHDLLRPDPAGDGTWSRCIKAAKTLTAAGAEFNILTVVTKQLAAHPDKTYRFYKQHGFRFIQLIPCLDGLEEERGAHRHSLDPETYGSFLCRFFDLWYADFIKGDYYSVRSFDNYIRMLMGQPPENCAMAGSCNAYALIEADGSVYPCDFYATDDCLLGSIADHSFGELLGGEQASAFVAPSKIVDDACKSCRYYAICRGGCRRDREPLIDGVPSLNYFCGTYKRFFDHALPRMAEIARKLRAQ
ncbi:MAG: anaerobic sulfatase maturase [Oscillospiraceae bacterium]